MTEATQRSAPWGWFPAKHTPWQDSRGKQVPPWAGLFDPLQWIVWMAVNLSAGNKGGTACWATYSAVSQEKGGSKWHSAAQWRQSRLRYDFICNDSQMRQELGLQAATRQRPHPESNGATNSSNKQLRKPDWQELITPIQLNMSKLHPQLASGQSPMRQQSVAPGRPCYTH